MKKIILTLIALAVLPSFVSAQENAEIVVTAKRPLASPLPPGLPAMRLSANYIVRNLNGDQVCNLAKGDIVGIAAMAPDGERMQIKVLSGPCAGITDGFVYMNFLRPPLGDDVSARTEIAKTETNGLSLRSEPSVEDGTFTCALPRDTKLNIVGEKQKRNLWVQVEIPNPPPGCPKTGWVVASYLKPDVDFSKVPKMSKQAVTEAQTPKDCTSCDQSEVSGGRRQAVDKTADDAREIDRFVNQPASATGVPSPFLEYVKDLQRTRRCPAARNSEYKCNRGLVQMPVDGNAGFCGTHHYTPDRPPGVDAHASPHTACALVGLAQEWKKTACPNDNAGCRIAWGDISHATKAQFNGHREHTNGNCIDIRPFNKGAFRDAGRNVSSSDYDREMTAAFIRMAKKYGGDTMFSDRRLSNSNRDLGISWGGSSHANHMHICFENQTAKNACNNLTVDPNVCSELQ